MSGAAQRVEAKQLKTKMWYDCKWKTKSHSFKIDDWVRIRKPCFTSKCSDRFSKAMKIVKFFDNSVITQDGKLWNVKHVAKCPVGQGCGIPIA